MLFVSSIVRWFGLLSLSEETQKIMLTSGKMLQNAVRYNAHGQIELHLIYDGKNGKCIVEISESDGKPIVDNLFLPFLPLPPTKETVVKPKETVVEPKKMGDGMKEDL